MILDKWKAIFIHIPRTAGGSTEVALLKKYFKRNRVPYNLKARLDLLTLNEEWTQHYTIQETIDAFNINPEEYFKFCFTRNPWDKALSEYMYIKKENGCHCAREDVPKTFNDWCVNGMQCAYEKHLQPQIDFILDVDQNCIMDFVGSYENLEKDLRFIFNKYKIKGKPLYMNETRDADCKKKKHYTEYYNDETREIVQKKFAKDIEYFGYKFGG